MTSDAVSRGSGHSSLWMLLGVLILAGFGAAAEAHGITPAALGRRIAQLDSAVLTSSGRGAIAPERQRLLVWRGADVDGDGQEDFVNPTGKAPRTYDAYGSGAFGASRDGGVREHEGVDYVADPGQAVRAPISGFVSKIGYAYADDMEHRYVEISNPALHYVTRVFYVDPAVSEGEPVRLGETIGTAVSLQDRYGGITDHVHLEIAPMGGHRVDATRLIVASYEDGPARAGTGPRIAAR